MVSSQKTKPERTPKILIFPRSLSSMGPVMIALLPKIFAICVGLVVHERYRFSMILRSTRLQHNSPLFSRPIQTLDRSTSARYSFLIPPKTFAEPFLLQIPAKRVLLSVRRAESQEIALTMCCLTLRGIQIIMGDSGHRAAV